MMRWGLALLVCALAAGCAEPGQPPAQPTALAAPQPVQSDGPAAQEPLPEPTAQRAVAPNPSELASVPLDFGDAVPAVVSNWRPPPYPAPWALRPEDHFLLARPIPSGEVNWPNPRYRYGSTAFGEETIHTGVDLGAARHTPVLAAGDGEVVWVGFGLYRGIEDLSDPYGLAIALRHDFGPDTRRLYTIYAHLQSAMVWPGQRVHTGEQIGTVGDTGRASAPHLHFEVRLGDNRYFDTRNPELWMVPAEGWGVLAGRIEGTFGRELTEYLVQIRSLETQQVWEVWTYALGTVVPDEFYQENFVISDLPAGPYAVQVDFSGRRYVSHLFLQPGQTNTVHFAGRLGFLSEPTQPALNLLNPPRP